MAPEGLSIRHLDQALSLLMVTSCICLDDTRTTECPLHPRPRRSKLARLRVGPPVTGFYPVVSIMVPTTQKGLAIRTSVAHCSGGVVRNKVTSVSSSPAARSDTAQ
jgi:hypothetical protein